MSARWQVRLLIVGLMLGGVLWIHLMNYINLGSTPLDMFRENPLDIVVFWGGAIVIGLVLDSLFALRLRRFFAAQARLRAGEAVAPEEVRRAAAAGIAFPAQATFWLMGGAVVLSTLFHMADYGADLLPVLTDPARAADRVDLFNTFLQEQLIALLLALLLFTFSRRILRDAIAGFDLREVPAVPRISVGVRVMSVVLFEAVTYTSYFATTPPDLPRQRMLWLYIPIGLISGLVGYLVAADTGRDLRLVAGRLRGLAAGLRPDLFHRLAVTGQDEVADLLAAINALQDRMEAEFRAIESDLQAARSIQTEMLPRSALPPPGWDVAVRLVPAQEVGGDFYDIIPLPGGRFGVAVGDAAGRGLPAALLMASTVSLLRSHAPLHERPGPVLEAVNRLLCSSVPAMSFVTAAYAVVDPERRQITLASAGHLPPLVAGHEAEPLSSLPLGVEPGIRFPERTFALRPGESFLLCSDGLAESADPAGDLLGVGRLEQISARPGQAAGALVDQVLAAALGHAGGRPLADDVTAVALVAPVELVLELPSQHGSELTAAIQAEGFAREHGPAGRADDVATAVGEACLNAVIHGNGLRAEIPVRVTLRAGPGWLEAVIADTGPPFTPPERPPDLAEQMAGEGPIRGWGIHLIRSMADEMRIETAPGGKQVRLRFYAGGRGSV